MRWLIKLQRRLHVLFGFTRIDRDMDAEMRYHIEQSAQEAMRAGRSPVDAQRLAMLAFGGIEQHKEAARDARGGRWIEDSVADLRFAFRQFARAPLGAAAIIAIMATGIAGAGISVSVVRAYLGRALPVPNAERLAYVLMGPSRHPVSNGPDLRGVNWSAVARVFPTTAGWDLDGFTIADPRTPDYVSGAWVSRGYFELLGIRAARGRLFSPDEYRPGNRVALISTQLWQRRFGSADSAVGAVVRLFSTDRPQEEELVTIVGVMPTQAWRVNGFQDLLRPLGTDRNFSLAQLPAGTSLEEGAARMTAAVRNQLPIADPNWHVSLVSAHDEHVYLLRPTLRALLAIALMLLLMSVASVSALLLARSERREREFAMRRALGASTARLARQLIVETGVLWGTATAAGLALTASLSTFAASQIERLGGITVPGGLGSVYADGTVFGVVMVASLLPFLLLGVAPLIRVLRASELALRAHGRATSTRRSAFARRMLVTLQVSLAVGLLVNASLLARTVRSMSTTPLGFDSANLLKAHVLLPRTAYATDQARVDMMQRMLQRIQTTPGVSSATAVHPHPFRGTLAADYACEACSANGNAPLRATPQTIAPNYFSVMSVPVVAGRVFEMRDNAQSLQVAIVSRAFAQQIGGAAVALGKRVRIADNPSDSAWRTVVGVVGDVRKTFGDTLYPDVYVPFAQSPRAYFAVMARTAGAPLSSEQALRQSVVAIDPSVALSDVESMEQLLRARRGSQSILASFASGAASFALALTVCALYAVVAFVTGQRKREFAVRRALGAPRRSIVSLVLNDGLRMLSVGTVCGLALAVAGAQLMRSLLFGVQAFDAPTYALTTVVVLIVAFGALLGPAIGAAAGSPASVLRDDG